MPSESKTTLVAKDLIVERGGKRILDRVEVEIAPGGPFAMIGESGSGKTTFLLCATGLLKQKQGEIRVQGEDLTPLGPRERATRVGLVFQDYQLFPHLTVWENMTLAPRLRGSKGFESTSHELLKSLGIESLKERYPHQLSGGQKQRAAIARSLVLEPAILFLDEPSAALDEKSTLTLAQLLKSLNKRTQIVVVSHDRFFVEACCDRGVRMENGRVSAKKTVRELFG